MPTPQRQQLRNNATRAERLLWTHLRKHRTGVKWRRQHPCGPYVVDFYCRAYRLVVELDGDSHMGARAKRHDLTRDVWLAEQGIRTLRFHNDEVLRDPEIVVARICLASS